MNYILAIGFIIAFIGLILDVTDHRSNEWWYPISKSAYWFIVAGSTLLVVGLILVAVLL